MSSTYNKGNRHVTCLQEKGVSSNQLLYEHNVVSKQHQYKSLLPTLQLHIAGIKIGRQSY